MIQTAQNVHRFGFMRPVGYIDENRFGPEKDVDHPRKVGRTRSKRPGN